MNEYEFKAQGISPFKITVGDGVFLPTHTSALCVEAALKIITPKSSVLDLGCGTGVVGIAIAKSINLSQPIFASDISNLAVENAKQNMQMHSIQADVRKGSLFMPWKNHAFNYIVDDVSGIAEDVAKLSPWFAQNIPCKSGPDGTELTSQVICQASNYLTTGGGLFFPVISLSNKAKIIEIATANFSHVQKVATQPWFLPDEMKRFLPLFLEMKESGLIDFEERFGTVICDTSIYYCENNFV